MRVLVVEDDQRIASYLANGLAEKGFVVDLANEGGNGLSLACNVNYDLLVLDVQLPGVDGLSILREMRESCPDRYANARVMFLSARGEVQDRVRGLELGADEYMTKPFAFSEFMARVYNLLRRNGQRESSVLEIADLRVDLQGHVARRAGQNLDLTAREFILLAFLARRRGHVQSRTSIEEHVWNLNFDSETNVVDAAIRRLRKKIDDPFSRKLIHTVRGVGYVLEDRLR